MTKTHTKSSAHEPPTRVVTSDVLVVGARCAGASTAMLLARAGHDVVMIDRSQAGTDTLSTHGLARTAMVQLNRWGLLDRVVAQGAPKIDTVIFHRGDEQIVRNIRDRSGVDFLLAPRRSSLDAVLQQAADADGARCFYETTASGVIFGANGRAIGVSARDEKGPIEFRARLIVGADGLRSRVARAVSAPITLHAPSSGAAHYAYFDGDWQTMEYFTGRRGFAGVFPTNDAQACIWVCNHAAEATATRKKHGEIQAAFDEMLGAASPELFERLTSKPGSRRTTPRGMIGMPNHVRQAHGPGWALVGDAGYHRDALTGHGISDAFRDAELLATAIDHYMTGRCDEVTALDNFEMIRDRMLREVFDVTVGLLAAGSSDQFMRLQKQLGASIDAQAAELAAWPDPGRAGRGRNHLAA